MKKMRNGAIRFKLLYEYLPSDDKVFEQVRKYRAEQRKKQKAEREAILAWISASPAILKHLVAKLRRVK